MGCACCATRRALNAALRSRKEGSAGTNSPVSECGEWSSSPVLLSATGAKSGFSGVWSSSLISSIEEYERGSSAEVTSPNNKPSAASRMSRRCHCRVPLTVTRMQSRPPCCPMVAVRPPMTRELPDSRRSWSDRRRDQARAQMFPVPNGTNSQTLGSVHDGTNSVHAVSTFP